MTCRDTESMMVGVLIPTYNRNEFLRLAVDSVLTQNYQHIEVIVIDNGSDDGTFEYMTAVNDSRLRYIVNEQNIGLIGSINKGVRLFSDSVEWCTILCDDDFLDEFFFTSMVKLAVKYPFSHVICGCLTFIDINGKFIRESSNDKTLETPKSFIKARSQCKRETYLSGVFFRKKSFFDIGGYPHFSTGWATDDAFIFHLGIKGTAIVYSDHAKCFIKLHDKAESNILPVGIKNHFTSFLEFKSYCIDVLRQNGLTKENRAISRCIDQNIRRWLYVSLTVSLQNLLGSKSPEKNMHELDIFFESLKAYGQYLPYRMKIDRIIYQYIGVSLEKFLIYRLLWRLVGAITK